MELMNNENSFEPTPRLKSSPTEILFVPFSMYKIRCDCGNKYSDASLSQKYCKNCLYKYIEKVHNFSIHLDIHSGEHLHVNNIANNLPESLYFKQIVNNHSLIHDKSYKTCELCGYKHFGVICSDCYQISFTWIKSTSTVPILHLPWWDTRYKCINCDIKLEFKSNRQKWCPNCLIIYTGCRYCLTTNIIFGFTEQSQCIKCERTSLIDLIENNDDILNLTIPIMFIPFNNNEYYCYCCRMKYSETPLFKQKYCKNCLYWYIEYATSNTDIGTVIGNLDVYMNITNNNCNKHEPRNSDSCIHGWCVNCSEILYFKQIITNKKVDFSNIDHIYENYCRICGKSIHKQSDIIKFKLCSDCYLITFEFIESTSVLILHLSWWDACYECIICDQLLKSKSDCQKWCSNCYIIYTGCRYCLTTNIIFGFIDQSQCKKCKRINRIISINTIDNSGSYNIDGFLFFTKLNIIEYVNNINKNFNPLDIYKNNFASELRIEWIPYSQITILEEIAEGGYGKIYKALINGNIVAIKEFLNSSKHFLDEIKSLHRCYDDKFEYIIKCHGIAKNPETNEFVFIMKLQAIHEKNVIHRDFHSGNILVEIIGKIDQYLIGDLGLSHPEYNTLSSNEIYGVMPYIAPEIFKGIAFSKASDIYSMGMIMWELTTSCKPFDNVEHDINLIYKILDGKRPIITDDTPEDFANLMKKCWSSDPKERPSAKQICDKFNLWSNTEKDVNQFNQAEEIRLELMRLGLLGPEFSKKPHLKAIYKSKPLTPISESSSTNSSNSPKQGM
ncbi:hypothetical protein RclHR1_03050020 [Rhizophagus clarus]|uniref:Protein kinase domain-containing protein n=1 Tax=Rhizophagus clarus TaxID=94130 RepID=A0A2Z6RM56_9GLOM|nr:hypothetical protein RclHR1_03050020 [Rhizophagus clarus]